MKRIKHKFISTRKALLLLRVDKEQFIQYTKSEEENERLQAIQNLLASIEDLQQYYHVYKGDLQRVTSNAVRWDMRTSQWIINPQYFK